MVKLIKKSITCCLASILAISFLCIHNISTVKANNVGNYEYSFEEYLEDRVNHLEEQGFTVIIDGNFEFVYNEEGNLVSESEYFVKPMTRAMGDYHTGPDGDTYVEIWSARRHANPGLISSLAEAFSFLIGILNVPQATILGAVAEFAAWVMENNVKEVWYTETLYINTRMTKQYKELQYYTDGTYTKKVGGIIYTEPELPTGI